jgi:hypothetical protein
MDIQTRKLNAIDYLIKLKDERMLTKIEATILELKTSGTKKLKPFTRKQLVDRAGKANQDYLHGNIKTQEQIESESANW